MTKQKVVVGLSGGVDSSVAAWLLKEQGFEVLGLFMKNWEDDDDEEYCSTRQDLIDVAAVADVLGIELEVVNFSAQYKERVFANFLAEHKAGRTPNPDVLCNAEIKFRAFLDHALALGAHRIATGHYAQVREANGLFQLLKAEDGTKDQSYFLHRLDQSQLRKTLFPLGSRYKRDVRDLARRLGLPNHDKKDSTGICFIGERPFREFLMRYLPPEPGDMVTPEGAIVGRHAGLMYYTIGQRQGLGIGGGGEPWYVVAKELGKNALVVAQGHDHPGLLSDRLSAINMTWVSGQLPHCQWVYGAKTRYRQADAPCAIARFGDDGFDLEFAAPQWAVTPGQSVVVYESRVCLGGGIIDSASSTLPRAARTEKATP
jgi:tRNA-specific 2-thiouridylase